MLEHLISWTQSPTILANTLLVTLDLNIDEWLEWVWERLKGKKIDLDQLLASWRLIIPITRSSPPI